MSTAKTPGYTSAQVHFPTVEDRKRVQAAAETSGVTFSTFVREAAMAATERVEKEALKKYGQCPTCNARVKKGVAA